MSIAGGLRSGIIAFGSGVGSIADPAKYGRCGEQSTVTLIFRVLAWAVNFTGNSAMGDSVSSLLGTNLDCVRKYIYDQLIDTAWVGQDRINIYFLECICYL